MAAKSCCIDSCNSSSIRKEDVGVTYHKFPKITSLRDVWVQVARHECKSDVIQYVCSRHFCKSDFQSYKDSKYILKSDAVPSIFPWTMAEITTTEQPTESEEKITPKDLDLEVIEENTEEHLNGQESECENLEAIKNFIEKQEKEITEAKIAYDVENEKENSASAEISETKEEKEIESIKKDDEAVPEKVVHEEPKEVATSVMDMILSQSEQQLTQKKGVKLSPKPKLAEKISGNNSMALSVGSKVEAKDFAELWHPANIAEVDYDEMEVLVHYEDDNKKHDEWISVSSPRLRPRGSKPPPKASSPTPVPEPASVKTEPASPPIPPPMKEEPKDKTKFIFEVGERCLCRWRDNRRFIATVAADLGDDKYEIIFDDGVRWTCSVIRLSKLKDASKNDPLTIDTSGISSTCSTPSPVYGPGPSNAGSTGTPVPTASPALPFNTHLFDPTRDYLGSKSERREMKRKLNIKEIFNIGQKKKKNDTPKISSTPKQKTPTPKVVKEKKLKVVIKKTELEAKLKKDIPDAVASIIGTAPKEPPLYETKDEAEVKELKSEDDQEVEVKIIKIPEDMKMDLDDTNSETLSAPESQEIKNEYDSIMEEEAKLEKFDKEDDSKHEEVLYRIKEVINKLEDGITEAEVKAEQLIKPESEGTPKEEIDVESVDQKVPDEPSDITMKKVKKVKKVKIKREKKVKKQVEKVKNEIAEMKKQVEEMRKQMALELSKKHNTISEVPESFLLPGEWCCKWVNGQPVGTVSEIEHDTKVNASNKPVLPRRSVQVEDKRLPPGWTKHMVRRSFGSSAGKWDVVLMSPENRRFHTKTDMKHYLENNPSEELKDYEAALMDFGIHLKLSRRMGWYKTTPDAEQAPVISSFSTTSPLVKKKHLSLKLKVPRKYRYVSAVQRPLPGSSDEMPQDSTSAPENLPLEDGFVYVGSLKVQIIENLLRCPAEGCFKNFRNNTLLKMHIKHYHRELRKMLGATPKVLDLAYARTRPTAIEMRRLKRKAEQKTFKVKFPRPSKRLTQSKTDVKEPIEPTTEATSLPLKEELKLPKIPRSQDSPRLRQMLTKSVKRPKVLLPVRKTDPSETAVPDFDAMKEEEDVNVEEDIVVPKVEVPPMECLDFETAISTHTVTKPADIKRKGDKKKKFASISKASEDEEWYGVNSDVETRSSFPRSGTPDSKMEQKLVSSESNEEQKEASYMYTENGERIKIVHMKREEIINCHCGFREEDGLMVQCELCLCWQHALCHNIQKESEVPEKYTCSICLNPRRGRRSQRFLHDQDRLYEGLLPGAKPCESLRRSHELSGNLHRIEDALHALRVKYHVATKKDHPKLYLWAKDWDTGEIALTQEKLNSDYSDLSIMISNIGKENLPIKPEDMKDMQLDIKTPPSSEDPDVDRLSQKDNPLGSQALLSGLLSSPTSASLDLPITTTELEKLAKTVQAEQEAQRVIIPQPEAAIENSACRERLLRHIQRCQALIDARLDSIEAQVAELESQDPSFEDDETADFFPRTKQTVQMLMRDLDTMEELGVIT